MDWSGVILYDSYEKDQHQQCVRAHGSYWRDSPKIAGHKFVIQSIDAFKKVENIVFDHNLHVSPLDSVDVKHTT